MFRKDGFGDTAFLLKYRFYASNEKNKSAMITAFLGGSVPTGSYSNGRVQCSVTLTLTVSKGFGLFDVRSRLGQRCP